MKKIAKLMAAVLVSLFVASCTEEPYSINPGAIPSAADADVTITVGTDNFVSFRLNNEGCSPVWIFGPDDMNSQNPYVRQFIEAGTYSVEVKLFNQNGMSDGSVTKEFVIETTYRPPFDPAPFVAALAGTGTKTWKIDAATQGHLGCGEPGSDGLGWWSAAPNDKADWSVYDNEMTFGTDGSYAFNPVDGMIYVNNGSGYMPEYLLEEGVDYVAPADPQTATYTLTEEGAQVYLTFPAQTLFAYIPNPEFLANPKMKVVELTANHMTLLYDNGSIAWNFMLIPTTPTLTPMDILTGGSTKTWTIKSEEQGHLGCGEPGSDGLGWWSAAPNDKADWSVYDNTMTFGSDGSYVFDPVDGLIYVNAGSGYMPEYRLEETVDYTAPAELQTSTFTLTTEDNQLYLTFPAQTLFTYIPNPEFLANPRFKVMSLEDTRMVLINDNGSIAWNFILTAESSSGEPTPEECLFGDGEKSWVFDYSAAGHLGCGEPGSDGLGWWNAQPFEKMGVGMYDDILTFKQSGEYVYNPGVGGTIYANWECGFHSELWDGVNNSDYQVPVEEQVSTWTLSKDGDNLYLTFPSQTFVGYICNAEGFATPRFRVVNLTDNVLEMLIEHAGITWHYRFIPQGYVKDDIDITAAGIVGKWTMDSSVAGHLGCGEPGSNGLGWWSAAPNEKEGCGVYDDILTFNADGTYTFDPGEAGTVYANWECGYHSELWDGVANSDYQAPAELQNTTYTMEGDVITFPANTFVGYIPNAATLANPVYKVVRLTPLVVEFITDNGSIAWHFSYKRYVN